MKLTMTVATMFGLATSVPGPADPAAFFRSLDAPPEALFMGVGLLFAAAMLRSVTRS